MCLAEVSLTDRRMPLILTCMASESLGFLAAICDTAMLEDMAPGGAKICLLHLTRLSRRLDFSNRVNKGS